MIPFPYGSCKATWADGPAVLSNFLLAASTNKDCSVLLYDNCFHHCAFVSVWYSHDKINGSLCSEVKWTNLLRELYFPPKLLSSLWDYKTGWLFRRTKFQCVMLSLIHWLFDSWYMFSTACNKIRIQMHTGLVTPELLQLSCCGSSGVWPMGSVKCSVLWIYANTFCFTSVTRQKHACGDLTWCRWI